MSAPQTMAFPQGFLWGTATSAHQVEGSNNANQWAAWEATPGHIWQDQRSAQAADWWQRAEEDLAWAAELGQNTHRLSIEWSRIEPQEGVFVDEPLQRYRRLLARMRELGLEPMVTLHHFTHPQWLEAQGGWLNPETPAKFARFAAHAAGALGDQVRLWCTINEPAVFSSMGYLDGAFPPGQHSLPAMLCALRNLLLGHAAGYHAVHKVQPNAQVGLVKHIRLLDPGRPGSALDRWLAGMMSYVFNDAPMLAIRDGRLPFPLTWNGRRVPELANTCDFIGINYYTRELVSFDTRFPGGAPVRRYYRPGAEMSDCGWKAEYGEIYPEGLYRAIMPYAGWGKPIFITENGLPDAADTRRPRFLLTHLAQVWRAIQEGADVRGYYHWSLTDNFEWADGWKLRFGLIELDPETQERALRRSGRLYAEMACANAITPEMVERYAPEAAGKVFAASTVPQGF
jgi:beta-glucosidase